MNEKPRRRRRNWKTWFCCLSDDDGDDDEVLTMLWVLCLDEEEERREGTEREVKGICSCREEEQEFLPSAWQEVNPAAWVFRLLSPSPSPPLCLWRRSRWSPQRERAETTEVDAEVDPPPFWQSATSCFLPHPPPRTPP